jgi:hypothetical protein
MANYLQPPCLLLFSECTYDTMWKKGRVVVGGEPTSGKKIVIIFLNMIFNICIYMSH